MGVQNVPVPGFRTRSTEDHYWMVAEPLEEPIEALGLLEPGVLDRVLAEASGPSGRGATAVLPLPGSAARLHLRPVRRGGWLAPLRGDGVRSLRRPIEELLVTAALREAGAPVPAPAALIALRTGRSWRAAVGTLFEEGALDAGRWLTAHTSRERVLRASTAAGTAIRRLHDAGCRHRDLHIGNLLVREGDESTEVIVVDLDRATRVDQVSARRRMQELMRLQRSLVKRDLVERVGPRGYARFWASYAGGDRALRRAMGSHRVREQLRVSIHAVGYRLSR